MKNPAVPKHPKSLRSAEGRRLWKQVNEQYPLEPHSLAVLEQGLQALERLREAEAIINRDGLTVTDRFGQVKTHPALLTERDCRAQFLRFIQALNIDLEPLNDGPGRPPGF